MRSFLVSLTLVLAAAMAMPLLLSHGAEEAQPPTKGAAGIAPSYVHNVIFYLKKDTPPAKIESMLSDCHTILGKIPTVRGLWVGRPAAQATPDVAVKDYQAGLTILFDNYDGLKSYLDHPTHLKFVETYSPSIEKVLVYDFQNQMK